jgi:hypothetical protein
MIFKERAEPLKLIILRSLYTRMKLDEEDKQIYLNRKKGFEGELKFDSLTEKLHSDCYILNDLLLKVNNTLFQIDTLIIKQHTLYPFEVKNFEGDFIYEKERLYTRLKYERKNPKLQLDKNESLLRQLLQQLRFSFPLESKIVYVNPEFTLYQAPLNEPIIFPTQINRYLKDFDMIPSKLNENHKKLADLLCSLHIVESPYSDLPIYKYDQLQKGLTCGKCNSFISSFWWSKCVCDQCGHEEKVVSAVLRNVEEFQLLFPDRKITTNIIYDWCGGYISKKWIRSILSVNFLVIGTHQWTYYVRKK